MRFDQSFLVVVPFIVLALGQATLNAQIRLQGQHLLDGTPDDLKSQSVLIYEAESPKGQGLYFTPVFLFQQDSNGKLDAIVEKPTSPTDKWKIRLTLLISPDIVVENVAAKVRTWAKATEKHKTYENTIKSDLIRAELTSLNVNQVVNGGGLALFTPIRISKITTSGAIDVIALMPDEQSATDLADDLRSGKSSIDFDITYQQFATLVTSESSVHFDKVSIADTKASSSLVGAGLAFQAKVDPAKGQIIRGDQKSILIRILF